MFGLSLSPAFYVAGFLALGAGAWYLVDQIGDIREAKVHAHYAEVERKKKIAEEEEARAGEEARQPAFQPGSVARLKANWCRDCGGKP